MKRNWGQAYVITISLDCGQIGNVHLLPNMARRPRLEIEGGLYHIIARGNNGQPIFHSDEDHKKFLSLLEAQKQKLGFFL